MKKDTFLILGIISIAVSFIFGGYINIFAGPNFIDALSLKRIDYQSLSLILMFAVTALTLWITSIVLIYQDCKARNKNVVLILLPIFVGGIGTLIYYLVIKNESGE